MFYARKDDMAFGSQACGITDIILIVDCAECTKDTLVELRHSNAINGAVYWYDPKGSPFLPQPQKWQAVIKFVGLRRNM